MSARSACLRDDVPPWRDLEGLKAFYAEGASEGQDPDRYWERKGADTAWWEVCRRARKKFEGPCDRRWGSVTVYGDGFAEVKPAPLQSGRRAGGGKRGRITQSMGPASKLRFSRAVSVVPKTFRPVLVTVTLPGSWDPSWGSWSWAWKALDQWLRGKGASCAFWRREFQARGAPHWHLAVFDVDLAEIKAQFAKFWSELWARRLGYGVMSKTCREHFLVHAHEKCVELARSKDRWRGYLLKDMLKSVQDKVLEEVREAAGGSIGRSWGILGRRWLDGVRLAKRQRKLNEWDAWAACVYMDMLVKEELRARRTRWSMRSSMRDPCVQFAEWLLITPRVVPF